MENAIFSKLKQVKSEIESNIGSYDLNQINELIIKLEQDLKLCVKPNEKTLSFFKARKNFRAVADLRKFSSRILNYELRSTRRADIEIEMAKVSTLQNFSIERFYSLLGNSNIKSQQPVRIRTTKKSKKIIVEDQTSRWIGLSEKELESELNDLNKYPDVKVLKQAAYSILKSDEKRFRLRDKIINTIIERISEERALAHFGR